MSEPMDLGTVIYSVDGPVATVLMNRPEVRNAQSTALIEDTDKAFDLAADDDEVRVVILAGAGDHFCAGHDLKAIVGEEEPDEWRLKRATAEGKLEHEQVMYFDKCMRIRDFPKPTIARVQGACAAAGMMLVGVVDLVVAADDAFFTNPVLKMSGAGVELLVEPYLMGFRAAKEFLLTGRRIGADEALALGMVNRVVDRAELEAATAGLAAEIAKVPPITAQMVKRSINEAEDLGGKLAAFRQHFMIHQFTSNTKTALDLAAQREATGSVKQVIAERDGG
ncbi:MAG TPA: enoyl-CoA hydratase [Nitriliruptorales bacterium]